MSVNVTSAMIEAFSSRYEHFSQQMDSRIASIVRQEDFDGVFYNDDYIDPITGLVTNRATGSATESKDVSFTRNRLECATKTWSTYKAEKDIVKIIMDPKADIVKDMVAAFNRERDIITLASMVGDVMRYDEGSSAFVASALPAAQKIDATTGGMTVNVLLDIKEKMDSDEVSSEDRYIAISASGLRQLLEQTEITSADYNTVRALASGSLDTFLGFKFIHTELCPAGKVIAFQKDRVLFGYNMDRNLKVEEDPAHNFDYVIFMEEQFGAIRREDTGVVEISI